MRDMLIYTPANRRTELIQVAHKYQVAAYNTCGELRRFYQAILEQVEREIIDA